MAAVSLFWDTNMAANVELAYQKEILKTMGAFHSTKTSGLNFRQFPVANGTAFSKISNTEHNLVRNTQIFENSFR